MCAPPHNGQCNGAENVERSEFTRASVSAAFGCWIGFLFGPNAMIAASNSNYMNQLPAAFDVSRTAISAVLAIAVWTVAICVPFAGRAMDRFGVRKVVLPGVVFIALMMMSLGLAQNIWQFAVLQVLLSIGAAIHVSVGYAKVISLWFDKNRGLVLGLCVALGAGVGQTIMPKLSQFYIDTFTWRGGYALQGLMILALGFPLIFFFVKTPKDKGVAPASVVNPADRPGLTRAEALRKPTFYLVFFAIYCASLALLGTLQHGVPILTERGFAIGQATTALSLSFMGLVLGEFSSGFLVDRFNTPRIVLPYFVSALIGVVIVHTTRDPNMLLVGALMMGLGLGGEIGQNAYLISRYFGLKNFGSIYGLTFAASNLGIGTGLIVLGFIRDHYGSYAPGVWLAGGAMSISVLCVAALGPFAFASPRQKPVADPAPAEPAGAAH